MAWAILTAMWPSPPRPTTATFLPGPAPQRRSGEYVVMPAHSSGAAAAGSMPSGTREDEVGVDDDVGGVAALGGGAVAVGAGVGGDHAVEAVLLVAVAAVGALAAGVDHAADADAVADVVAGDVGADLGDDADDLVAGHDAGRAAGPSRR